MTTPQDKEPSAISIHCRSSESMRELDDDSVTLTVTSPPYWNAIDYDRYATDPEADYRRREYHKGFGTYDEYLALMQRIFTEVYRATKPGGICAVVVGSIQYRGRCYPIPSDLTTRLQQIGWRMFHEITWHKCRSVMDRGGVVIQHPYPGYYHPNVLSEQILVFRKPGPRLYHQVDDTIKHAGQIPRSTLFTRDVLNNVWNVPPVPPKQLDHPCPFPEEIAHRLIVLYSYPGDLVLDPFLGSGQTTKVAKALGRRYTGYDIEQRFVDCARQRLQEPLSLRSQQLIPTYDRVENDPFTALGRSSPGMVEQQRKRAG